MCVTFYYIEAILHNYVEWYLLFSVIINFITRLLEEYTVLITDVSGNSKKPTLYATALMAHLFTDKKMKDGSVEPKES